MIPERQETNEGNPMTAQITASREFPGCGMSEGPRQSLEDHPS